MENNNNQPSGKKNKNIIILAGAVIIVIILALLAQGSKAPAPVSEVENTEEVAPTEESAQAPVTPSNFEATYASYEGKRFVITGECQVDPSVLTISPDTTIMVFNDSDVQRTVTVDGAAYKVGVKKYRTMRISQPGSLEIGCDGKANVATLIAR